MKGSIDVCGYDGVVLRIKRQGRLWKVWTLHEKSGRWFAKRRLRTAIEVYKIAEDLEVDVGDTDSESGAAFEQASLPELMELYWEKSEKCLPGVEVHPRSVMGSFCDWEVRLSIKSIAQGRCEFWMVGEPDSYGVSEVLDLEPSHVATVSSAEELMAEAGQYGVDAETVKSFLEDEEEDE